MDVPMCKGAIEDDTLGVILLHQDAHDALQLRLQPNTAGFRSRLGCCFRRSAYTPCGHALVLSHYYTPKRVASVTQSSRPTRALALESSRLPHSKLHPLRASER